jgi:hypothetical protein
MDSMTLVFNSATNEEMPNYPPLHQSRLPHRGGVIVKPDTQLVAPDRVQRLFAENSL